MFGRQLGRTTGSRGPPGVGYKLTADDQFDVENKRLRNVATPRDSGDAVNLDTLRKLLFSEVRSVYNVTDALRSEIENIKLAIQMNQDETAEKIRKINAVIQTE